MTSLINDPSLMKRQGPFDVDRLTRPCVTPAMVSLFFVCLGMLVTPLAGVNAQDSKAEDSNAKILADQQILAEQYELLEKKLFSLLNPER